MTYIQLIGIYKYMSTSDSSNTRYQALIQLLRTAEDLWNASREFFARWDLSPSQFNVLNLLHGNVQGLSQSELSRQLIMHRSNVTGLVDRLERRGLVQRRDHAEDRRAYRVVLTFDGTALLEKIYPHYFAAADRVWANTPTPRVEQLLEELREIAAQAAAVGGTEGALASLERESTRRPRRSRTPEGGTRTAAADTGTTLAAELRTSDL